MDVSQGSAIVTGGGSGLGQATARRLAAAGAQVFALDLPQVVERVAGEDTDSGVRYLAGDITDEKTISAAISVATAELPLRSVVHCAGRGGDRVRILDRNGEPAPVDTFRNVIEINLVGTYTVLRLTASAMAKNEIIDGDRGAIVLTASVAAFEGQIGQTAYTAAKAGVHGITIVAARDLANRAIRVNTIAPGIFDTPMLGRLPEEMRARLAMSTSHPQRLGAAEDYAHMALSMLENSYLNGHTVRLDAGIRMSAR